jgi:short-subunit dehydrogenase
VEELRGCNALVTGAGGGLGGYIARSLAAEGVNLAVTDLPEAPVDGLAAELRSRGVRVEHAPADLTDRDERRRLAGWAEDTLGPLDVLVNNAGVEFGGSFLHNSDAELETIVAVNLLAVMDLCRLVLPGMLERGRGHIVNLASLAGKLPAPYLASYAATKHGVVGLTYSLRVEFQPDPVSFSAICPGFVREVGMYGRHEHEVEAPRILRTVAPEQVGQAVVRAIREDRPEVIVNAGPTKPLILLIALAPRTAARIASSKPMREFMRRSAAVRGRL